MTKHTHGLSVTPDFFDICSACGEQSFDGIRCQECGSVSEAYLHDKVRRDLAKINREWLERQRELNPMLIEKFEEKPLGNGWNRWAA